MKRIMTAVAAVLVSMAILPAQATTFYGVRLIYIVPGAVDSGASSVRVGTSVPCTNQSGLPAYVRWFFYSSTGTELADITLTLSPGETRFVATFNGSSIYNETLTAAKSFQGKALVFSNQTAVFCSAIVGHPTANEPMGIGLHMIRYNGHTGMME